MARSKAAAALAARCRPKAPPELLQADLAEEMGVPPQAVSAWLKGHYKPSLENMLKLEKVHGVPVKDWAEPDDAGPDEKPGAA